MTEPALGEWWRGIPAVTVTVHCGDDKHRLTWRDGELLADDHDVTGERALAALGGTLPYCVAVLDAWNDAGADPYLVSTWGGQSVSSVLWSELGRRPRSGGNRNWLDLQQRRIVLRTLPEELYDRLALGIVAALSRGERHPGLGGLRRWQPGDLNGPVSARAVPLLHDSIASWRRRSEPSTPPIIECRIAEPDEGASVDGRVERRGGWVEAAVGPDWLVEVWGRGVALVDGCFVLAAHAGEPVEAVAVRWEHAASGALEPVTGSALLEPGAKGWRLHWT